MRPGREPERHLGPDVPVLRRRHHVDLDADAGLLPLLDHGLDASSSQSGGGRACDLGIDAVRIAGVREERLRLGDIALDGGSIGVFGMHLCDVMMLARVAEPAMRCLEHGFGIGRRSATPGARACRRTACSGARAPPRYRPCRLELIWSAAAARSGIDLRDVGEVDHVDLLRGERRDLRRRIIAEVDDLEARRLRAAAPVGSCVPRTSARLPTSCSISSKAPVPFEPTLNSPFSAGSRMRSG